ncbi:hypothetical protein L6R50_19515 [Myxococcota bacterium]|nr:hypothetical protein [Myxococcota bacterium]
MAGRKWGDAARGLRASAGAGWARRAAGARASTRTLALLEEAESGLDDLEAGRFIGIEEFKAKHGR